MTLPATFIPSKASTLATITSSSASGQASNGLLGQTVVSQGTTKTRFSDIIAQQKKLTSGKSLSSNHDNEKKDSSTSDEEALLQVVTVLSNILKNDNLAKNQNNNSDEKSTSLNETSSKNSNASNLNNTDDAQKNSYNLQSDAIGNTDSTELLQKISDIFASAQTKNSNDKSDNNFIKEIKSILSDGNILQKNTISSSDTDIKQKLYDLTQNRDQKNDSDLLLKISSIFEATGENISVQNNISSNANAHLSDNKNTQSPLTENNSNDVLFKVTMTNQVETGKSSDKEESMEGHDFTKSSKSIAAQTNHDEAEDTSTSLHFETVLSSAATETPKTSTVSSTNSSSNISHTDHEQTSEVASIHIPSSISTVTRSKNLTMTVMTPDNTPVRVQMSHSTDGVSSLLLQAADDHTTEALQKSQHTLTRQLDDAGIHTANMKIDVLPTDAHNFAGDNQQQQMGGHGFSHNQNPQQNTGMGGGFYEQQQGQEGRQPQKSTPFYTASNSQEGYAAQKEGVQLDSLTSASLNDDRQGLNISV